MDLQILCRGFPNDLTKIEVYNRYILRFCSKLRLKFNSGLFWCRPCRPNERGQLWPGLYYFAEYQLQLFYSQRGVAQDQDAAQFFSSTPSVHRFAPESSAYDLSVMHAALPMNQTPQNHSNPLAWATDFVQQQPVPAQELAVKPQSGTDIQVNAPSHPGMSFSEKIILC